MNENICKSTCPEHGSISQVLTVILTRENEIEKALNRLIDKTEKILVLEERVRAVEDLDYRIRMLEQKVYLFSIMSGLLSSFIGFLITLVF